MASIIIRIIGLLNLLAGFVFIFFANEPFLGLLYISVGIGLVSLSRWGLNLFFIAFAIEAVIGAVQVTRDFNSQMFVGFLLSLAIRMLIGLYFWSNRKLFVGRFNKLI